MTFALSLTQTFVFLSLYMMVSMRVTHHTIRLNVINGLIRTIFADYHCSCLDTDNLGWS